MITKILIVDKKQYYCLTVFGRMRSSKNLIDAIHVPGRFGSIHVV